MEKWRWALAAGIWVQAWIAEPWLLSYLPLPAPLGHLFMWRKVWGMLLVPAVVTLLALIPEVTTEDSSRTAPWFSLSLSIIGMVWQTQYLLHHLPPDRTFAVAERWISAAIALTSLTISLSSPRENAPPALEILASAALVLTFIARPPWAVGLSLSVLGVTVVLLRRPTAH
ncbi:hypothetical protein [Sulfobacillus harzensis]|uniref:Uncharacterized protein n=1 Tax=Sulfobacillus harzensis TaxID=2729629 RepID=A0A7Y0Q1W8_9FIRM|nr:hypothetical protein [Sulfobacillus harzensis]NMP22548.1 hypothetical protein [Sulfobacillus harzensis]